MYTLLIMEGDILDIEMEIVEVTNSDMKYLQTDDPLSIPTGNISYERDDLSYDEEDELPLSMCQNTSKKILKKQKQTS